MATLKFDSECPDHFHNTRSSTLKKSSCDITIFNSHTVDSTKNLTFIIAHVERASVGVDAGSNVINDLPRDREEFIPRDRPEVVTDTLVQTTAVSMAFVSCVTTPICLSAVFYHRHESLRTLCKLFQELDNALLEGRFEDNKAGLVKGSRVRSCQTWMPAQMQQAPGLGGRRMHWSSFASSGVNIGHNQVQKRLERSVTLFDVVT